MLQMYQPAVTCGIFRVSWSLWRPCSHLRRFFHENLRTVLFLSFTIVLGSNSLKLQAWKLLDNPSRTKKFKIVDTNISMMKSLGRNRWLIPSALITSLFIAILIDSILLFDRSSNKDTKKILKEVNFDYNNITCGGGDLPGPGPPQDETAN